jgi:membrane-bound lytic murein transglycosylase MltF
MKRIVLSLFVLVLAVPVVSVAQARPDFTGRWVIDPVGKKPLQTMVIKHTATRIVIERYRSGESRTIAYALDGSESITKNSEAGKNLVMEKSRDVSAWAIRKNTPEFKRVINDFIRTRRAGTLFGNVMRQRYLGSADRLKNPLAEAERQRFDDVARFFRKYGKKYDLPWLLIAAQGYQESGLDQSKRSPAGAVGIMQVKPSTAADPNIGIRNIQNKENNIHAGVKYLRFVINQNFQDKEMDRLNKGLFALASYNAGPARVAGLRRRAATAGLNPNLWFNNVEIVAAREIGHETVDYVSNIYKYYVAYHGVAEMEERRAKARSG